ncbi:MAG: hypothetical protein K6U77_00140 [Armatimonadetes bacterium]|nr:hypothetical protein [Armatimonadota bacterium]
MRKWKVVCGIAAGVALLVCAGALGWVFLPPRLEVPPRQYPPNNAYPEYGALREQMRGHIVRDARLTRIERAIVSQQPLSAADRAYYLQQMAPYLRRYEQLTQRPSMVVYERDITLFPKLAGVRELARIDSYFMREELRQRRYRDAIRRAERLMRLADQVRNGGLLTHYLVGAAVNAIAIDPIREELPRIRDRAALEALLQIARAYEQQRVPLWKCIEEEYYLGLKMYQEIATGRRSAQRLTDPISGTPSEQMIGWARGIIRGIMDRYLAKTAIPEYRRLMPRLIEELKQPPGKRPQRSKADLERETRHPLNQITIPELARSGENEAREVVVMRLIGCTAAIRLHKLRTGNYPASLEALQLGEMIIDPFSGKPFVYKTDPRAGFLLYSVSLNGVDDGGVTTYLPFAEASGDLSPVKVPVPTHLKGTPLQQLPPIAPIWLR